MNTAEKGRRFELEIKKELENDGWLVWKTTRTRYGGNDLFGVFDIFAIRVQNGRVEKIFIQAGHESGKSEKIKEVKEFLGKYPLNKEPNTRVEVWIKKRGKWVGRGKKKHYRKPFIEKIKF